MTRQVEMISLEELVPADHPYRYFKQILKKVDGFSQAITRLLKKTNIDKFSPRDLRRTFKTLAGKAGISKEVRDRLQNHSLQDVSSLHYDRYVYLKEKRAAMKTWNDYLMNILNRD